MTLVPELQAAVDNAQKGEMRGLHQMILGPAPSGKTTQARAYAEALAAKGIGGKVSELDISMLKYVGDAARIFATAKGGTLVIDELEKTDSSQRREILSHAVRAISDGDTLVIITGALSLENDMEMEPGLSRRMNKPVILDRQLTRLEMNAFNDARRTAREAADRERIAQEKRAQRVAEWKAAKNEDLLPGKSYAAPKTARFRKPEGAR